MREMRSRRPPTRYNNREDQVLWERIDMQNKSSSKQNNAKSSNSLQLDSPYSSEENQNPNLKNNSRGQKTNNKLILNYNSSQGNINHPQHIRTNNTRAASNTLSSNDAHSTLANIRNLNNLQMNNTFNIASLSPSNRMNSPNGSSMMSQKNFKQNLTSLDIPHNNQCANTSSHISSRHQHSSNTVNLHSKSKEKDMKVSSEFRKTLKMKLNKNSTKIFENLKRLTERRQRSETSRPKNLEKYNESAFSSSSRSRKNSNQVAENDENYMKKKINKVNDITTNLTESKYILNSSTNKTPNFNYNTMKESKK
jgi:hypothetical protein